MNTFIKHWKILAAIGITLLVAVPTWAQQATARFSPERIYPDETATYEVNIEGARGVGNINLPSVEGLNIISQSQGSNMRVINGTMSTSVTLSYGMQAEEAGTYTMPSFKVGSVTVPATKLEVLPMTAARRQELEERERRQREAQREIIGMDLLLNEGSIYVGQAVPMRLTIYARSDLYTEPLARPVKEGDAFTIAEFTERPTERSGVRNNRRYREFVWENILTPLKAGTFPLQFKEAFVIGRSFFNHQNIELSSEPREVEVLPLPTEGQPFSFDGAIGNFSIERPTLDATRLQAGEPLTMRVVVSGEGNFDRMGPPMLEDSVDWRVYPPEDSFRMEDPFGYRGVKTYEFVLIPKSESVTRTPPLRFSFFEPETAEYVELKPEPLAVEVLPAPPGSRPAYAPKRDTRQRGPTLLPLMSELGDTRASLRPIFVNPLFLAAQVVPLLAILGLFFWKRQQLRLDTDRDYARRLRARREVPQQLQVAEKAVSKGDATAFFEAAMRAIQEAVAPDLRREPESLAQFEVEAFLASRGASEEALTTVQTCFEAADAIRFGGIQAGHLDLAAEFSRVKRLVTVMGGDKK